MSYTDQSLIELLPSIAEQDVALRPDQRAVLVAAGERLKSLIQEKASHPSWMCRDCGHPNAATKVVTVTHCGHCELLRGAPKPVEHVCGLMGFDGMKDTCPGCEEARRLRKNSGYAFLGG